jgi:hypothetical protein
VLLYDMLLCLGPSLLTCSTRAIDDISRILVARNWTNYPK